MFQQVLVYYLCSFVIVHVKVYRDDVSRKVENRQEKQNVVQQMQESEANPKHKHSFVFFDIVFFEGLEGRISGEKEHGKI